MLTFALFATLPLALSSLFDRNRGRHTAGLGFLAALAPVIAKGIGSLIGSKQKKAQAKQAEEQKKLEAEQADQRARQEWEASQNTPAAQQARFKSTLQLGRLAGGLGGIDKVPPSIAKYYNAQRAMPTYTGTSSFVPTAKAGGGFWNALGGIADAASYFDVEGYKAGKKPPAGGPQILSSDVMPGSARPTTPSILPYIFDTGQIKRYQFGQG